MSNQRNLILPTPEEDEEINRGAAQDPDNPLLTDAQLADMRPTREAAPKCDETMTRRREAQHAPVKQMVSIRLDADVVDRLRASGDGWQTRVNALLRAALQLANA